MFQLGLVEGVHIAGEKTDDSYRYLGDCDLCPSFGTSDAFMQRYWFYLDAFFSVPTF
jgi:hypothetical protein